VLCGTACENAGGNNPRELLERWNGKSWSQVATPKRTSDVLQPAAIPGGVWVSAKLGRATDALRFTGNKWVNTGAPGCGASFGFAAFSASDAWAFGNGRCAARYDGRRWHVIHVPFDGQYGLTATWARNNFWLLGITSGKHPHHVLLHWTGRWHTTSLPAVPHPAGFVEAAGPIAATGPNDIWVAYGAGNEGGCCEALRTMEHWDGKHWNRVRIPYSTNTIAGLISDGDGGFWMLAGAGSDELTYQRLYHYAAGHWSRVIVPAPSGDSPSTLALASIPGTRSAWAVASLGPWPNPMGYGQAVIYKYGP
jgi:hypothetical protein